MEKEFTESYFLSELNNFRAAFGTKDFWKQPIEKRDLAVKAISFTYFNTQTKDQERLAVIFDSVLIEYSRRGTMLGILT